MNDRPALLDALGDNAPLLRRRKSLAEEAADTVRRLILLEKLSPGAPIAERELAEGLGISRTPLREAMKQLEREGLVEYSETRRPRVANPTLDELADALRVLGALEALAGEQACTRATDDEIAAVTELDQRMTAASDTSEPLDFFDMDMEFHRTIVATSRNTQLMEIHAQCNARLWRARFISSQRRPNRARTLAQHSAIANALAARDAAVCATALGGHLVTAIDNIGTALAEAASHQESAL